jgi:competence protein ComEC
MRFPAFWLAVAYATGLALFADVDGSPRALFVSALAALAAGAVLLRWARVGTALAAALAGFFLAGGATAGFEVAAVASTRADRLADSGRFDWNEAARLTGWLRRAPLRKPYAVVYELELESLEAGGARVAASGGVLLTWFPPENPKAPVPRLPALEYGDRVEVLARVHPPISHRNPGSFDWRAYLARQDIYLEGSLRDPALLTKLPERRGARWLAGVQALRTRLLDRLDALFPPDSQADANSVLRAMLLGDRGFLSHRLSERFRLSGAYHVLVVSGLHVGVIAWFAFQLLRRMRVGEVAATLGTVAFLVFYLLLVEDRPPIERAVWMAGLYLAARLFYRHVHLANTTALAALAVLFLHPDWLFDPSFHLSFAAVFLIAFFALPWIERSSQPYRDALGFLDAPERGEELPPRLLQFRLDLRAAADLAADGLLGTPEKSPAVLRGFTALVRAGLRAWEFFVISFAIQLGLLLLTALYFDRVVWTGLLTNVLVVPLVGMIVPLGLVVLLSGALWHLVGSALAAPLGWLVSLLVWLVDELGRRGLSYGVSPPPVWLAIAYLAALAWLAVAARARGQRWVGLALAALAALVVTHPFAPALPAATLELTVLDVGQGDALFLAFPQGETWLVDAGRGPVAMRGGYEVGEAVGETVVVPYLRARGIRRLDRVWLTHTHHDHMAGLAAVFDEFPVAAFEVGPSPPSAARERLLARARARGIPVREHAAGERFDAGDVKIEVLWPAREYQPGQEPSNNDSLVLRLCRADTCLLLPGDIEAGVEKRLAMSGAPLVAAVLKVPHHGGRAAATAEFLAAVRPAQAVLSVGATNPFGHPFADVVARLEAGGVRVYRTDRDGSVTARVGEDWVRVASFNERQRRGPYPSLAAKLAACLRALAPLESD